MTEKENLGSFLKENKVLLKDYLDTQLEIFRLRMIRLFSKSAGYLMWIIVLLFLFFLLATFTGLVVGFWLTEVTGSYIKGFGYTTLIMLGIIILVASFRKVLFVDPVIRMLIRRTSEHDDANHEDQNKN